MSNQSFGHLTPMVELRVRERLEAGDELTSEMLGECLRAAVDHDNELILNLIGESHSRFFSDETEEIIDLMGRAIYASLRARDYEPQENPKWTACREALGREPKVWEFLTFGSSVEVISAKGGA